MEPKNYIKREGSLFTVGNDESGFQSYGLKITSGKMRVQPEQHRAEEVAQRVFEHLKSSLLSYKNLEDVVITSQGILSQRGKLITANNILDFETTCKLLNQENVMKGKWKITWSLKGGRTIPPEVARGPLDRVAAFFKRLKLPRFLVKIYEFFEKLITPTTYEKRHRLRATQLVERTPQKLKALKACRRDGNHVVIPQKLMMTAQERRVRSVDKKVGAQVSIHEEFRRYRTVPQFKIDDDVTIKGYKINVTKDPTTQKIREDYVIPTAFKKGKPEKADRLVNCYMGGGVIRTGVIDTSNKAKEFVAAARYLHDVEMGLPQPSKDVPLRIVSHQLNSPEVESDLVKNQHRCLVTCDRKMKDVEIAHINTPCNRFVDYTRDLKKIGLDGILKGEKKSKEQNIEGMMTYLKWMFDDFTRQSEDVNLPQDQKTQLKLAVGKLNGGQKGDITEMVKRRHAIYQKLSVPHKDESVIQGLRLELTSMADTASLLAKYNVLKTIETEVFKDEEYAEFKQTVTLLRRLLGVQLDREEMSRGQELMMYQLLNQRLGVISAMNCKSGLDRTGFYHAVTFALKQLEDPLALVMQWDTLTVELNQKFRDCNFDVGKVYVWKDTLGSEKKKQVEAILTFRLHVIQNLLNVSLPITAISTGVLGLKWGKGMKENLVPLNFIPPVVKVDRGEQNIEEVQIIEYSAKGHPKGLTRTGHDLLTQLSQMRGT